MFAGADLSEGCPSTGKRSDMSAGTGLLGSILETRTQPAFKSAAKVEPYLWLWHVVILQNKEFGSHSARLLRGARGHIGMSVLLMGT